MSEARFLIDTNSLVYLTENVSQALRRRVKDCAPGEIVTSSIVFAEYAFGVDWAMPDAQAIVDRLFETIPIIDFGREAAVIYATLPFRGNAFDRLIAAHALALDVVLITSNVGDFDDVSGLRVEDWTQ